MKARMKKIQLMLHHGEKDLFLQKLQDKGILHLETTDKHLTPETELLIEKKEQLLKSLNTLSSFVPEPHENVIDNAYEFSDKIQDLNSEIEKNVSLKESLQKELNTLAPWGDFKGTYIDRLQNEGIRVKFYITTKKVFEAYDFAEIPLAVISVVRGIYHFIVFEKEDYSLPFDGVQLPEKSADTIRNEIEQINEANKNIVAELKGLAANKKLLQNEISVLNDQIIYQKTSSSFQMTGENIIHHIQGWIPEKDQSSIIDFLNKNKIAFIIDDPDFSDDVPIVLKNRKYPKIFETITNVFELPNYRELDLTPVIAVFYPIFFAYCLGDSGYGLIFIILFSIGYFTFLKENKVIAALGIMLGIFTMVIGIIKSGTMLGIPITTKRDIAFFDFFSRFVIIPETGDNPFNAFNVALILGLVQIIVGVVAAIFRAWIYESFESSLASIGKLFIIVCTVVLFLGSSQGVELFLPYTGIAKYGLIGGIALVLLFTNIRLPILKRIFSGVLPLYFIFTGLLGDTLSYIRLFALGISSGILGLVINNIGNQIMSGGVVGIIIGVIFLIFGHALNLFISGLGSFVHPLRLTFVEFYNNAGFKGGGIPFKPFKKETLNL